MLIREQAVYLINWKKEKKKQERQREDKISNLKFSVKVEQ